MTFKDLNLIPPLLRAVGDAGYQTPSPIQEKAIPPVLAGRDLLGCAQTGTGKTAAFALPILQLLEARAPRAKNAIRALIMTPTRELALQIEENFELYGKYLKQRSAVIFGGVGQQPQVAKLRRGVDVLVATPGRLNDLIGQGHIDLANVEIFVLDEADRMLDMGFVHDVKKVIAKLPQKRQTLLFSATLPDEIVSLADSLLNKPAKVFVTPVSSTVESIEQCLYKVDKNNKRDLLADLLKDKKIDSALVFTRTKHGADRVAKHLNRVGISAAAIHGNKSQGARQDALAKFKNGGIKALVATDIAARGLDINELSHVFNYDLPNVPETYVHRIGRTGRAGHDGIAISFCQFDELEYLKDIQKLIGFALPEVTGHAYPMQVFETPPKAERPPRKGRENNQGGAKGNGKGSPNKTPEKSENNTGKNTAKNTNKNTRQEPVKKGQKQSKNTQKPVPESLPKPVQEKTSPRPQPEKAVQRAVQTREPRPAQKNGGKKNNKRGFAPYDPYENRTGGSAIITKTPVWNNAPPSPPTGGEGEDSMSRNRKRGGKNRKRGGAASPADKLTGPAKKLPEIPKDENGLFHFSEDELAEDTAIQVISRKNMGETKYASFEDYLKDHEG